jgi:hypothetical protein
MPGFDMPGFDVPPLISADVMPMPTGSAGKGRCLPASF